jgi:3-phosphoshikimate 1-carboxyvinyltransferase
MSLDFLAHPGGHVNGPLRVPGDKSISHRSIMLGALADGKTVVDGFLEGEDAISTINCFRAMGVQIDGPINGHVEIHGVGIDGLKQPSVPLDCGNSGTSMRLLSGLIAGQAFSATMIGDVSLSKRPMERVAKPLRQMGADIQTTGEKGTPPITLNASKTGCGKLKGINYVMPVASAQVKSAVLLAGLYAEGETIVTEPAPTRDHTERMLSGFGYTVHRDGATAKLSGGGRLTACHIDVPADISSAAFFMVAASIAENSEILLTHVGINPTRTGVIDILKLMGANIALENHREVGGEPVADLRIKSAKLKGIEIPEHLVPLAIDEFPVLFVAAACAEGRTILTGAEELRVKESDRIQVMADGLIALGIKAEPTPDGIIIDGGQLGQGVTETVNIITHHDHRIAMSFAVASLRSLVPIHIRDVSSVATSFPNFFALATGAGMRLELVNS